MCTALILRRPGHAWPVIFAANRDEMRHRPWQAPARHWADRPEVIAGLDEEAGGTWLGINDYGVVAGILNRMGSLGAQAGKRSRGELVLEALDHAEAEPAAAALSHLNADAFRSFNLVIADPERAFWLRNLGDGSGNGGQARIGVFEIPAGLSMFTAYDRNDTASPRIRSNLPRFEAAPAPDPDRGDWRAWQALLASRETPPTETDEAAMTVVLEGGFETVSSSLIALPAPPLALDLPPRHPIWLFAPGRPDPENYEAVDL